MLWKSLSREAQWEVVQMLNQEKMGIMMAEAGKERLQEEIKVVERAGGEAH
jgi:hypothetical protein